MTTAFGSVGSRPALPGLVIRAIRADDAGALRAFHRRLSPDTVKRRFFGAPPDLSDAEAKRFTQLPAGQQVLVAIVGNGGHIRFRIPLGDHRPLRGCQCRSTLSR